MAQDKKNITVDSLLLDVFHPSGAQGESNHSKEKDHLFLEGKTNSGEAENERVDVITHTEKISFEDFLKNQ